VIQLRREARAAIAWRRGCSVARWTRNGEASFRRAGLVSAGCDARADGVAPAACTKLWPRSAEDLGGGQAGRIEMLNQKTSNLERRGGLR
jgi:hypothetical protein